MIKQALDAYAASQTKVFKQDRSQTLGASEVGACCRQTWFKKNVDDPTMRITSDPEYADGWGARTRGNLIEDGLWTPAMRARYGDDVLYTGDQQRTLVSGFLSATPDGLLINQPSNALSHLGVEDTVTYDHSLYGDGTIDLDCKSIDPRVKVLPKPEHVFQIHVQIGLIRELTNHKPLYGVLSYIDASFCDSVQEFAVRFDPQVFEAARKRAIAIMGAKTAADVRPEGVIAGGKECDHCAYTEACGAVRAKAVPVAETEANAELRHAATTLALDVRHFEKQAKDFERQAKEAGQQLKEMLAQANTRSVPGVCVWSSVKGRKGLDFDGLKQAAVAAGVDLTRFEKVGPESDRLTIAIK